MVARFLLPLSLVALGAQAFAQSTVDLDFSSEGTSLFFFAGTGGSVSFTPDAGGYDFQIGDSNIPGLVGLQGDITGTFTAGPVTPFGSFQEAPVVGTGLLTISDGSASLLTSSISWKTATTLGTGGSLNTFAATNLSNFSYGGSNPALQLLANATPGIAVAGFQFTSPETLTQLASGDSPEYTSYSGSPTAIPEPPASAVAIGAFLFVSAVAIRRARRHALEAA
jgi:hypothetical protein